MRLLRWSERLYQYDFDVVYKPGSENQVADMLSPLPARDFEPSNSESAQPIHTEVPETGTSGRIDSSDRWKQARLDLESEEESFQLATIFGSPTLQ